MDWPTGLNSTNITSYIHTATLCTTSLDFYKKFYGDILELTIDRIEQSEDQKIKDKAFWNIPASMDYDLFHFYRKSVPSLIHLRVLHLKSHTPHIHQSYNSYELGSFSLGFPTSKAYDLDKRLRGQGIQSMAPTQVGDIVRSDGVPGQYIETIYQGPDFLHIVGIERVNISQLAPCDPVNGLGGPGYSALVARDAQAEIEFYQKVLGWRIELDQVWETAEGSALGIDAGAPFRFTSLYAPVTDQNYLIILEFKDGNTIDTGIPSCPPHQGLGMYTFMTKDIDRIKESAEALKIVILSDIQTRKDAILGEGRYMVLQSPNHMYIEIKET